jgi:hypothetical protein
MNIITHRKSSELILPKDYRKRSEGGFITFPHGGFSLQRSSGGGTCSVGSEVQTNNVDWDTISGGVIGSQYIASITGNVCRVRLYLSSPAGSTCYVQLRSTYNGGGSQYGSNSENVTITSSAGWFDFPFASPVSVSSAFYVNMINGANTTVVYRGDNGAYNGATGNYWVGAVQWSRPSMFEVWTLQ